MGLLENSLEPCLVRSGTGILEHVGVVLPSRRIVPGRHDTSEADASRSSELKILQCDFPVIMHDALKVRIEDGRRVYRGNDPMGREFYGSIESKRGRINRLLGVFKRFYQGQIKFTDALPAAFFTPDLGGALDVGEQMRPVDHQDRLAVYMDVIAMPKIAHHIQDNRAIVIVRMLLPDQHFMLGAIPRARPIFVGPGKTKAMV